MKLPFFMGRVFIYFVWGFSLLFVTVFAWIIFNVIEIKYLPKTEHEAVVQIVKASGNFEDITTSGKVYSTGYLVRFDSGKEKRIDFRSEVDFDKGEKVKINYLETKITNQIILKSYEVVGTENRDKK